MRNPANLAPVPEGAATNPQSAEIVVLEPGGETAGAAVLSASHADYPAFGHAFRDPERRRRALEPFHRATVRDAIPFGAVYGADEAGRLLGIAVWLPAGAFPWSAWRKLKATGAFLKVWRADPRAFRAFTRLGEASEVSHPKDGHWSLEALGIRPEAQRRGLGSRLMRPVLDRADAGGVDCYLETSDPANVAFYERFGFKVVQEGPLVPGGPPHVAMRRSPGA